MRFHILTLFPDMVEQGLHTSIIGRAVEKGLLAIEAVNIRDYTLDKHKKVDDYPYGGGAGMVMQAQPIYDCLFIHRRKNRISSKNHLFNAAGTTFYTAGSKRVCIRRRCDPALRTL